LDVPLEHACGGDSPRLLNDESHGEAFIQNPELPFGGLVVGWVHEDTPVQQGSVNIRHHGAYIPEGIGFRGMFEVLDSPLDGLVPLGKVPLVDGVDLLPILGDANGPLSEQELSYQHNKSINGLLLIENYGGFGIGSYRWRGLG